MALRQVGARLIEKKQEGLAIGLTSAFSTDNKGKKMPYRQQIAMVVAGKGDQAMESFGQVA